MQFIDKAKIKISSGKGGNGVVAWRREKFVDKGGPAGGERGSSISSSTVINIYPQQMDEATIDYIYDRFNAKAGAAVT